MSKLALKGSSKTVCDYFEFSINSILFQRGIYPSEDFQTVKKYDIPLVRVIDEDIKSYINQFLEQIKKWVYGTKLQKLILVIIDKDLGEGIERWEFELENNENPTTKEREKKEIQTIIRQITSSSAYLPILTGEYTFNILAYTQDTPIVPTEWADSQDLSLQGDVESVNFSRLNTGLHSVGTKVSYRLDS